MAGTLLKPYENASDRALIRKTNAVEDKLLAKSLAVVPTFSDWLESSGSREPGPKNTRGSLWAMGAQPPVLASK